VLQIKALRIAAGQHTRPVGVRLALKAKVIKHSLSLRQRGRDLVKRLSPPRGVRPACDAEGDAEPMTLLPLDRASV